MSDPTVTIHAAGSFSYRESSTPVPGESIVQLLTVTVSVAATDAVVVRLSGEADLSTASQLSRELRSAAAAGHPVEVDLAGVRFFDSSCLGALSAFGTGLRASGRSCRFVGVPPRTRRLLELTGRADLLAP
jgi:anti-anti-sigma factor